MPSSKSSSCASIPIVSQQNKGFVCRRRGRVRRRVRRNASFVAHNEVVTPWDQRCATTEPSLLLLANVAEIGERKQGSQVFLVPVLSTSKSPTSPVQWVDEACFLTQSGRDMEICNPQHCSLWNLKFHCVTVSCKTSVPTVMLQPLHCRTVSCRIASKNSLTSEYSIVSVLPFIRGTESS